MIQKQTIVKIIDNSGAKLGKCIKIIGDKDTATIGDIIIVTILQLRSTTSKIKKGNVYKAIVINTKRTYTKRKGIVQAYSENTIALMNKQKNPIATRIIGPVPLKIKKTHFQFASISAGFI